MKRGFDLGLETRARRAEERANSELAKLPAMASDGMVDAVAEAVLGRSWDYLIMTHMGGRKEIRITEYRGGRHA